MSRYSSGVKTDYRVLRTLALQQEIAQYDLPKIIRKSYHTMLRHLRVLENEEYIKLVRNESSDKGGKDKKIYSITSQGLFLLLSTQDDIWKDIDVIAKVHSSILPLIFGKIDFFEKIGFKNFIIENFRIACFLQRWYLINVLHDHISLEEIENKITTNHLKDRLKKFIENSILIRGSYFKQVENTILEQVYFGFKQLGISLEHQKFLSVAKQDKDINNYVNSYFKNTLQEYSNYLENMKEWRKWWDSISDIKD